MAFKMAFKRQFIGISIDKLTFADSKSLSLPVYLNLPKLIYQRFSDV